MAIARFLNRKCLPLQASRLWLRYAALQNLIPSLPWIAPQALHPSAIQEGIKFCHLATLLPLSVWLSECISISTNPSSSLPAFLPSLPAPGCMPVTPVPVPQLPCDVPRPFLPPPPPSVRLRSAPKIGKVFATDRRSRSLGRCECSLARSRFPQCK